MDASKKIGEKPKKAPAKKGKIGAPAGNCNNPKGRPKGTKNKISYDVRKLIFDKVSNKSFIDDLFADIKGVNDKDKRAKLKIELIKLFVPRPLNDDEEKDQIIKSAIFDKLSGKKDPEE